eukprot:Hpha_TRINITY_DN15349_c1_g2::TRINITY_DN15349_c1_g2_i1::g.90259::m.90259
MFRHESAVKTLTVVMIGPHLSKKADSSGEYGGLCLRLIRYPVCFDELRDEDRAQLPPPDLYMAFNSGLVFYSSWRPTLRILSGGDVPFCVTAWAMPEAIGVRQTLHDLGWEAVEGLDLQPNPFASLVPQRVTDDHGTCNFNNRYFIVMRPTDRRDWLEPLGEAEKVLKTGGTGAVEAAALAERALAEFEARQGAAYGLRYNLGMAQDHPVLWCGLWLREADPSDDARDTLSGIYGVLGASLAHAGRLRDGLLCVRAALRVCPRDADGHRRQLEAYSASLARFLGPEAETVGKVDEEEEERAAGGCCGGHSHAKRPRKV